jgi:hypothetical protein
MALKADRDVRATAIHFTVDAAAEAGQVLIYGTQPSGAASGWGMNDQSCVATPLGTGNPGSGHKIAGVLLHPVVDIYHKALAADGAPASGVAREVFDNRYHRNWHNGESIVGEHATLGTDGWVLTNRINGIPTGGDPAYLGTSGNFQNTAVNGNVSIGKFETAKDSDGYARVSFKFA